jgi:hypothetical protein
VIQRITVLQHKQRKSCCRKWPTTESDSASTPSQPKKKVFISESIGQSKSTEDERTDAYTSSSTTVKHWRKSFKSQVLHQPITSALKKSGYWSIKPHNFNKNVKANYYQPEEYFSDSDCRTVNYNKDHHTPAGLIDHDYIWQAKQQ